MPITMHYVRTLCDKYFLTYDCFSLFFTGRFSATQAISMHFSQSKSTKCEIFEMELYVTGMEFRLSKRQRGLDAFIVIGDSGMDSGRCADELQCFQCTCTVVFPLEDQSRQS